MREGLIRAAMAQAGRKGHKAMLESTDAATLKEWRSRGGKRSSAVRRKKKRAGKSLRRKAVEER